MQGLTSMVKNACKRMAYDCKYIFSIIDFEFFAFGLDLLLLTREHGESAMRLNLLIRLNTIATQLLMNEIQISYWHALNMSRPKIWSQKPAVVVDRLLVNGLFAKINTCEKE